ncbi:MAG TPA: hypothetical protein VFN55_17250 [Solirubrobacteraceae bacterium]|nr:hypothetical protein [Solirubrobacteraceae bacterium]
MPHHQRPSQPHPHHPEVNPEQTFVARRQRQLDREQARLDAMAVPVGDDPADAIAVALALPLPRP